MKIKFFLFVIIISFFSCTDNNPISSESEEDKLIKSRLVGYWNLKPSKSIIYRTDNTYIDSSFYRDRYDTTSEYSLRVVTEGKYTIKNAVLTHTNIHIIFLDTVYYKNLGQIIWGYGKEVQVLDSCLLLTPVEVLKSVEGTGDELWGTWTITKWTYICGENPLDVIYEGREKHTYYFIEDSSRFTYGWEYIDGDPFPDHEIEFTSEFYYDPPSLSLIGPSYYIENVEFKDGYMYWYYGYSTTILGKSCTIEKSNHVLNNKKTRIFNKSIDSKNTCTYIEFYY